MFTTVLANPESSIGEIILGIGVNEGFCNGFRDVRPICGSRSTLGSIEMRENLKNFINSNEGSVPSQLHYVRRTAR